MSAPNLPNTLLKLGLALAKYHIKNVIGDEALEIAASTLTDVGGEKVQAKVDSIFASKEGQKELLKAAKSSDEKFKKECKDNDLRELFAMDYGNLPSVQEAIAELPKALDDEILRKTLFTAFRNDAPKSISNEQINEGVNLYVECLQSALLPVEDFGQRIIYNALKEIGKDIKDIKGNVDFLVENAKASSQVVTDSENSTRFLVPFHHNPIVEGINLLPYDYDQRIQNFLTEYLGTDSHPVPFGGRDKALKMLNTWLAETTPYLLLAAPAGRGKSALLVHWLESLKVREDLSVAFVPVSIRFGTNMERVFYAALAARLAFLHGDDVPASPEISAAVYRGLVSDYLSKPLFNWRTLLVVLDGLDEAADWQAGADFMPGELPAGVRVVVSARLLAGDADSTPWLRRLNWERNELAFAPSLTPLDRAGVADVLLKMGCPLDELSRKVDIVAELYRLSEGDPLLVGLYVGDLWDKGEGVTRLKSEDLENIQPSYDGYFDRWWDDQKKLWGRDAPLKEKCTLLIFSLLSTALGGLAKNDILTLDPNNDLNTYILENAFDVLKRFVISISLEDKEIYHVFTHPKLREYFWNKLSEKEQTQLESLYISWGEQVIRDLQEKKINPTRVPLYLTKYYGAHLIRANSETDKLYKLVSEEWLISCLSAEGSYNGFLNNIDLVWNIVKRRAPSDGLWRQIFFALVYSSVVSQSENFSPILIKMLSEGIWSVDQSLSYARTIGNLEKKFDTFIGIIPILGEDIQNELLLELLNLVLAVKNSEKKIKLYIKLSKYKYIQNKAIKLLSLELSNIVEEERRTKLLCKIVRGIDDYEINTPANILTNFSSLECKAKILYCIAPKISKKDKENIFKEILRSCDSSNDLGLIFNRLGQIADELLSEELISYLDSLPIGEAKIQAHIGLLRQTKNTLVIRNLQIEEVESLLVSAKPLQRVEIQLRIAERLPEGPHKEELFLRTYKAVQNILNLNSKLNFLLRMRKKAPPKIRVSIFSDIAELAGLMKNSRQRGVLLAILAREYKGNYFADFVHCLLNGNARTSELSLLAKFMPSSQLAEMLDVIQSLGDDECGKALNLIIPYLPEGLLEKAHTVTMSMTRYQNRINSFTNLADVADAGRRDLFLRQALKETKIITNQKARFEVLTAFTKYLSEEYQISLLDSLVDIQDEYSQSQAITNIAPSLSSKALKHAFSITSSMSDIFAKGIALASLGPCLSKELMLKAVNEIEQMDNEHIRYRNIMRFASRLSTNVENEVYEVFIQAATGMKDIERKSRLLISIFGKATEQIQRKIYEIIIPLMSEFQSSKLANLLMQMNSHSAELQRGILDKFLEIAPSLQDVELVECLSKSEGQIDQSLIKIARSVVEKARHNPDRFSAVITLSSLPQFLTDDELDETFDEVVEMNIEDLSILLKTLKNLMDYSRKDLRLKITTSAIKQSIRYLLETQDSTYFQCFLGEISANNELFDLTKNEVRSLTNSAARSLAISLTLPLDLDIDVLFLRNLYEEARQIRNHRVRSKCQTALVNSIKLLDRHLKMSFLNEIIWSFRKQTRATTYRELAILAPIIVSLDQSNAPIQIVKSVNDVEKWWA
jgi:hypothetical protein